MDQRKILEFYHLSTPFPTEWPAENNSDESEDEELKEKSQRRKSRYQALEKARKSMMPKGRSSNNSSAVQMDEPDPLGTSDSVKSASLKVLVESNFERFVKAKATIDNVYREMKYRGADQELLATRSQQQTLHARRASRNSFRNSVLSPNTLPSTLIPEEKKKNALLKESEYGVMGIKSPLLEVSAKAEDVWGPALGGREKENSLKLLMNNFERYKEYTELGSSIADSIKRKDLESLVEDYNKARQFVEDSRNLAKQAAAKEFNLSDGQIYQLLIAGRMWSDVEDQIQIFKRSIWRKLTSTHQVARSEGRAGQSQDQYMEYITLLLELGVDQNPIYMWLASEWEFLKAWNTDAENVKYVEDWHRSVDQGDVTKMPASFAAFEGTMLAGMQKILYISEAMSKSEAGDIVLPPPAKLQQMVRSQYVTTLYKALSGMVENAERSIKTTGDDWTTEFDRSTLSSSIPVSVPGGRKPLDAGDRNVRMLLTLSNLQALRSQVVPSLNSQFENAFSVKLTDESKTIKDVLGQIDARLFQSYTRPAIENLRAIIKAGISSPSWVPRHGVRPTEARPYIYEALLSLVLIHSQVSTTTPSLTNQILSFLLEQLTQEMLEVFKVRDRYPLEALMQATLDVEFVSQTLSQYTSPKAGDMQGVIYQELDSRTDNDARARLQSELPEMRNTLKKLREASKNEFACFRKPKRPAMPGLERRDTDSSVAGY
ncbi:Exocyst complex component SEC5 [Ceratocystis platani]|uniref:Exocyst complex component SEC5 n=1 Tax=Ceratocystis fimbriata f. sp. platani TaxID=88771 RepID=A0A0F8DPB9_CERFI|nr:Exocyst complex component SEC5 [Ceratocystis platani]